MATFNQAYLLIAAFVSALVLSIFSIPNIIFVTKKKRLFDLPDNDRKIHTRIVPNLGGVGIFFAYMMVGSLFITQAHSMIWNYIATASFLLFITGLKDDLVGVSPGKKLIAQIVAAFIVAYFGNLQITNLYGLFGIYHLPNYISLPFTIVGITFVTNALNLIDGVDGLAGSISVLASFLLGCFLFLEGNTGMSILSFTLMGSIIGFLYYNLAPAKIFMGDTGSLLLGFTLSVLGISFINSYSSKQEIVQLIPSLSGTLVIAAAILFMPIFDTFRVFGRRILHKRSPFSADKTHLHHYLIDAGCNHNMVTLTMVAANFLIVLAALVLQYLNINLAFLGLILLGTAMVQILLYMRKRRQVTIPLDAIQVKKISSNQNIQRSRKNNDAEVVVPAETATSGNL